MICIYCGKPTSVVNSRPQKRLNQVWRRRQCVGCRGIFTTLEKIDYAGSLMVRVTSPESLSPFVRDKLFLSVYKSLSHRKTVLSDASALTDTILSRVLVISDRGLIDLDDLRQTTRQILAGFDQAAGVHYAAFHPGLD